MQLVFFIAKAVFISVIQNASKQCFGPFVSDIGNSNWFIYQISEPTSIGLLARGAPCLYSFPYYLQGLFARAQPVYRVSEPTSRRMFARAAACFPTYLKVIPGH